MQCALPKALRHLKQTSDTTGGIQADVNTFDQSQQLLHATNWTEGVVVATFALDWLDSKSPLASSV